MADYHPLAPKIQEQDLKGKVAVVTGATKGIGRAISLDLLTRGCSVLGTYSTPQSAQLLDDLSHTISDLYHSPETPASLRTSNCLKLSGVVADILSLASIEQIVQTLDKDFGGKIDILVLNAAFVSLTKLGSSGEADIANALLGNLHWPIAFLETITKQKLLNPNARVVTISSDRSCDPAAGTAIYSATKAGLESLTRSWALELPLIFPGTTVNAVSVGLTDTPLLASLGPKVVGMLKEERFKKVKVFQGGRLSFPEDIADVVGWLVSEKSRWVTGSVVSANGGAEYIG